MALIGIEKALHENCSLQGFRSKSGIRIIQITQGRKLKAYGQHFSAEGALAHANEDYLVGRRITGQFYDGFRERNFNCSRESSTEFDQWLGEGNTVISYFHCAKVIVELRRTVQVNIPENIIEYVTKKQKSIKWKNRGFTFKSGIGFSFNGERGINTKVIRTPKEYETRDPWSYTAVKIGTADKFYEALQNAFKTEETETRKWVY